MSLLRTLFKVLTWPAAAPLTAVRRWRRIRARALRATADRLTLDARAACVVGDRDRAVPLTRQALAAYEAAPPGALRALRHLKLVTGILPRSLTAIEAQLDGALIEGFVRARFDEQGEPRDYSEAQPRVRDHMVKEGLAEPAEDGCSCDLSGRGRPAPVLAGALGLLLLGLRRKN